MSNQVTTDFQERMVAKDRVAFVRCNMETLRIASTVFKEIQNEFPDITMELDKEHEHVDLMMEIPEQEGITHGINLNLQNDELHLSVANFWCEWFPCTDAEVVADYKKAVIGYIRGDYRLLEYSKGKGVYRSKLQAYENGRWSTVATSSGYLRITFASVFSFEKSRQLSYRMPNVPRVQSTLKLKSDGSDPTLSPSSNSLREKGSENPAGLPIICGYVDFREGPCRGMWWEA